MRLRFVVPDRPGGMPSGGDRYDEALAAALGDRGWQVEVVRVGGAWPWPDRRALAALDEALGEAADASAPVLLDGLVACPAPAHVVRSAAQRPTAVLVHSRLSAGAGASGAAAAELDRREAEALTAAGAVVTPSRFSADELRERYRLDRVYVARPGVRPAEVAGGSVARSSTATDSSGIPRLLTLAAISPPKNHAVLLEALAEVQDLPWAAVCAGPVPDMGHLRALRARAQELGLARRLYWPGAVLGSDLDRLWSTTDLLVHPSRTETFGLVVAEAHAHGIPTVVGSGTGAVEALVGDGDAADAPGTAVATDDPAELVQVLRRWLTDHDLRQRWRTAALARREQLPGWEATAAAVEEALAGIGR